MNRLAVFCAYNDSLSKYTYLACGQMLFEYMIKAVDSCTRSLFILSDGEFPVSDKYAVVSDMTQVTEEFSTLLVFDGCTPLITTETLERMMATVESHDAAAVKIQGGNAYCFNSKVLNGHKNDNFAELFNKLSDEGLTKIIWAEQANEELCVTNAAGLAKAISVLNQRKNAQLMESGVILIDPNTTYVDADVVIGENTVIYPNNYIMSGTVIGANCTLYPGSRIENSVIADGVTVQNSVILKSNIGEGTTVGPFAYLRPGSNIGAKARIGDFVEIKNANIGNGSKCSHLSYVGDADVGEGVNIGCGVVFVNYDGKNKFRSVVGDHAFVGSNSNLVAPVTVGDNAFIAAGSTVVEDVPGKSLCIARARQVVKDGWVEKKREEGK